MAISYDVKGELTRDGDMVTGWCWSPQMGRRRLKVQLELDGKFIGGTVAARLRGDLVRDGVCDGYHGFTLPLPSPVPSFSVIQAREVVTGRAFGRLVSPIGPDLAISDSRIAEHAALLAGMHRRVEATRSATAQMRASVGNVGRWLTGPPVEPWTVALPVLPTPQFSLVLECGQATWSTVAALAPILRHCGAEMLVLDRGLGATDARLAATPGLIYRRVAPGACLENEAARTARGEWLVFLGDEPALATPVATFLDQLPGVDGIFVGGAVEELAIRANLGMAFDTPVHCRAGLHLRLATPLGVYGALGGLDPALEDGGGLSLLDYALRAPEAGLGVHVVTAGWRQGRPVQLNLAARAAFARRWGA